MNPPTYWEGHSGPWCSILNPKSDGNFSTSFPIQLSKHLMHEGINFKHIESHGRRNIKVIFSSRKDANSFISNTQFHSKFNLSVKIPSALIQKSGIIYGIPADMSIEEFLGNTECSYPILSARRITKKVKNNTGEMQYQSTEMIEVVMETQVLPKFIYVHKVKIYVKPKLRKVYQCYKYFGFRHSAAICVKERKCGHCARPYHEDLPCTYSHACVNCKSQEHQTGHLECKEVILQQNINNLMEKENISYYEALDILKPRSVDIIHSQPLTYAQVISDNKVTKKSIVSKIISDSITQPTQGYMVPKTFRNDLFAHMSEIERKKDNATTTKQDINQNKRMRLYADENYKDKDDVISSDTPCLNKVLDEELEMIVQQELQQLNNIQSNTQKEVSLGIPEEMDPQRLDSTPLPEEYTTSTLFRDTYHLNQNQSHTNKESLGPIYTESITSKPMKSDSVRASSTKVLDSSQNYRSKQDSIISIGEILTNMFTDLSDDPRFERSSQLYKDYQCIMQDVRSSCLQ